MMFDNWIELISPGHLPDNLTVEKIRLGSSIIRNPILVSYIAKGLLPYRGLGSGIKRALEAWPEIDFFDDRDGCLFTAAVHRKETVSSEKSSEKILSLLKTEPELAAREIGRQIGISSRVPWKNRSPICGEKAGSAHRPCQGRSLGGSVKTIHPDYLSLAKKVRRQLHISRRIWPGR